MDGKQSYLNGSANATLTGLSEGEHILSIIVGEEGLYESNTASGLFPYTEASIQTVTFTVNTERQSASPTSSPLSTSTPSPSPTPDFSPTISILSPVNGSGFLSIFEDNTSPNVSFPLTYKTNEALSWVGYSIDGNNNVTVTQNGTILDLPPQIGNNTLTLYANDTLGNWATPQTVTFFIVPTTVVPSPTPSRSPLSSPSESPTQQLTLEPSPTSNNTQENFTPIVIVAALVVAVVVVVLLAYLVRHKGEKL